jgi:predicted dehydrogenase|tara:strand:- start:995 stop:2107 length:1113 start_codon:yes stop_codon:yes gene_type:complete
MLKNLKKPLTLSFIGGGINSSIGNIHYIASKLDSNFQVVSGFFSRNIKDNTKSAKKYNVDKKRLYNDLNSLLNKEINKVDFFVVLTPTPNHYNVLRELILMNANIIIEKPILSNLNEIQKIKKILKNYNNKIYVIHNYIGYPAIREIEKIIKNNNLGKLLHFNLQMTQESFLRNQLSNQKVKNWRKVDHSIPNLFLDLGVHLFNLSVFLIKKNPTSILSNVSKINNLVSDAKILLKYNNNISGIFWFSKTCLGNRNNLAIELYFEKCSIMWRHDNFEVIILNYSNGVIKKIDRSIKSNTFDQSRYNRYRMGHPSGFIEAFSNMYEDIARDSLNIKNNYVFDHNHSFQGIKFLEYCIQSLKKDKWIKNISL